MVDMKRTNIYSDSRRSFPMSNEFKKGLQIILEERREKVLLGVINVDYIRSELWREGER